MNIFYLTESLQWSGGAQQVLLMSRALRERGHEITLGCQPESDMLQRARDAGIATEVVRMRQDYDLVAVQRVRQLLKATPVDVFHAHHPTAHAIGLMAVYFDPRPVFAVTRRVIFRLRSNPFSKLKYRSSRIDGYVAISNAVRQELVGAGVAPARVEVIPSVMETTPASAVEGRAVRQEFGIPADVPLITHVANYAVFKGQDVLLEAAARVIRCHPNVHVLFAGHRTEELQNRVHALGLASSVHLAGFRRDVPRLLAASTIFVLPSLQEAAGTALREAMAVGLPSIGTRVGGIPDSIADEETGLLVPPSDVTALADALLKYVDRPEWAKTLGEKGRHWVLEQFSLDSAVTRMEAFYQRMVDSRAKNHMRAVPVSA